MTCGILFSHASENTVPGLVYGEYPSRLAASSEAMKTARYGAKFLIVTRKDGEWRDRKGRTPIEALRDGIDSGFRGWQP